MAAALVPLAALAFMFSYSDHLRRAEEDHSHFIDYARLIGQSSAKIMARTEGYAASLATRRRSEFADCRSVFVALRQELRQSVQLDVTAGEEVLCRMSLAGQARSEVTNASAEAGTRTAIPVSRTNQHTGIRVEIGLRPQALLIAPIAATVARDVGFALLDGEGNVVASHAGQLKSGDAELIGILDNLDLEGLPNQSFFETEEGWSIAAVTLPGTSLRILTGAPPESHLLEPWTSVAKALLLPLLLLAVVFVVLRYGTQRFLLRYIRHIYATFRRYGSGDTSARVGKLESAPAEINILGMTFDMMADRIDYRTRDLEASLAEQQRLTRELHHRIKNTLQMITSLLAMQRREAKLDCEQAVLRVALERVLSISAAYRVSYASNEGTDVALEALVREVVEALREPAMVPQSAVRISADEQAQSTIDLDKAIPLAFILAELLPPRFDRLQPGETIRIDVRGGAKILLVISGASEIPDVFDADGGEAPLRSRLMRAYLGQLTATCSSEGAVTRLEMPNAGA